jgi:hypothetical protein
MHQKNSIKNAVLSCNYYKLKENDKSLLSFEKSINSDLSIDNILVDLAYCIYTVSWARESIDAFNQ